MGMNNEVTLWLHNAPDDWYAGPHPDSITSPETHVYSGTPHRITPDALHDYISMCIERGMRVVIHVGS
jgi:hypothetical protein